MNPLLSDECVFTVPQEIALFVITVLQTWISPHLTMGQGVFSRHSFSNSSNVSSQGQLIQTSFWIAVCRLDLLLVMSPGSASSSCHCGVLIYISLMNEDCGGLFMLLNLQNIAFERYHPHTLSKMHLVPSRGANVLIIFGLVGLFI